MSRGLVVLTVMLAFLASASAQSRLPPCPADTAVRWHDCFGTLAAPSGSSYVGEFGDDKPNGQGTLAFPSGQKYVGQFRDGKRNGRGTYTFPSGQKYVGQFRDDRYHGQGTFTFPSGERYVGEFRDSRYHGRGTLTFPDGEKFVGEYRDDKRNGLGIHYSVAGVVLWSGRWEDGTLVQSLALDTARFPFQPTSTIAQADADSDKRRAEAVANAERRRRQELEQQLAEERRKRQEAERRSGQTGSSGTGFVVAPGHLITNQHVVAGCQRLDVFSADGRRTGAVVDTDDLVDLALVRVAGLGGSIATLRRPGTLQLGEVAFAFGYPLAGLLSEGGNFTNGIVSGLRGLRDSANEFQVTTPVQPGNSGGAVLDAAGNVIGVAVSKLNAAAVARATGDIPQNVNFAVSLQALADFLGRNRISTRSAERGRSIDTAQLAELARNFSHRIECSEPAAVASPGGAQGGQRSSIGNTAVDTTVVLWNQASEPIFAIYVSPVALSDWGDDQLGRDVLVPGDRVTLKPPSAQGCRHDVMVKYKSGKAEEKRNQDFCQIVDLKFSGPGQ